MNGFIKVIIAGAVIIGIGIAVLLIALGLNGWTFSPEFETKEFTSTETNTALSVNLGAGKLRIDYHDGEDVKITYPAAKGYETTVTESNGKISIVGNKRHWYTFSWGVDFPETVVLIPRNVIKTVDIEVDAGGVELAGGEFENIKIKVDAGYCRVGEVTGLDLVNINVNAGSVNVDGVQGDKIVCDVDAGRADVKNIDCTTSDVSVSAGLAELTFKGNPSEYTSAVSVSAGSCSGLSNNVSDTNKTITVRVSAGKLDVSFKN